MIEDKREMQKKAALLGLVFGVILLVIGIIALYLIAKTTSIAVVIASPILLSFLVPLGLAVWFCLNLRKRIGGYWSFRDATSGIFLMFFSAYFIYSTGNLVFTKAIDTTISKTVKENILKVTSDFASRQNLPAEQIDEKIEEMKSKMEEEGTPDAKQIVQGIVYAIIIIFVVSLIFAAIFKKEPPVFETDNDE